MNQDHLPVGNAGATIATPEVSSRLLPVAAHHVRQVMACLDRSPLAEACLPYAAFMTRVLGAQLTLLHVLPASDETKPGAVDLLDWEISRREAEGYLAHKTDEVVALGVVAASVHSELGQGRPELRVLARARELCVDLTVLARRGEGATPLGDLGATAQHVLANAGGSVLIVPCDGPPPTIPPRRILVPLDGSVRAESVLPIVFAIAKTQDAEVVLVHVVREARPSSILADAGDLKLADTLATHLAAAGELYLSGVRAGLLRDLLHVKTLVLRRTDTHEAILDVARDEKSDLVVLSAHGTTCNPDHRFGSETAHAIAHAAQALLVFQDLPEAPVAEAEGEGVENRCSHSNHPVG